MIYIIRNSNFVNIVAVLIIIVGLNTCKSGREALSDEFPINGELAAKVNIVDKDMLLPIKIFLANDKIIVLDNIENEKFKIFNLPGIVHSFSMGVEGNGPGEMKFLDPTSIEITKNGFEILEGDRSKIRIFDVLDDTIINSNNINLPLLGYPINRLRKISDSIYFADNEMTDFDFEHMIISTKQQKIIGRFGSYPEDELNFDQNSNKYQIYGKENIYNPYKKRFLTFYYLFNRFKIYDNKGNQIKQVDVGKGRPNLKLNMKDNVLYHGALAGTKDFLFDLEIGISKNELMNDMDSFRPKINIWDWDGNPVASYTLDQPIISFTVDEKRQKLYAITFHRMNEIYEYDLPDYLFKQDSQFSFDLIENDMYQMKMFSDWTLVTAPENNEAEFVYKRNGFTYSKRIFVSNRKKLNKDSDDICGASISIITIKSLNNFPVPSANEYMKRFVELEEVNTKNFKTKNYTYKIDTVNDRVIHNFSFTSESSDPKGGEFKNNHAVWLWESNNMLYEVSFASCNRYEEYYEGVKQIVYSIKNNSIPNTK